MAWKKLVIAIVRRRSNLSTRPPEKGPNKKIGMENANHNTETANEDLVVL